MSEQSEAIDTFMDAWADFDHRHPEYKDNPLGGMTWGFMRAIAECPRCPGVFRVPVDGSNWDLLRCPACGGLWKWQDPAETAKTKAHSRRKRSGQAL